MADFVAEWTEAELPKEYGTYSNWIMHFDGSKMLAGLGAGVVLTSPTGDTVQYVLQIMYMDSNNEAEYEALLHGLRIAVSIVLANIVAEWTEAELPKEYDAYSNWIMHFDGSKMLARLGAGVVLTSPTGDTVQYSSPNGQKPNSLKSTTHTPIGSCTSMAPKCWLVWGLASS